MLSDQSKIIQQAKITYFPLRKVFKKEIKTIGDQGIKQVEDLETLRLEENREDIKPMKVTFSKEMRTNEIKKEIFEAKWE